MVTCGTYCCGWWLWCSPLHGRNGQDFHMLLELNIEIANHKRWFIAIESARLSSLAVRQGFFYSQRTALVSVFVWTLKRKNIFAAPVCKIVCSRAHLHSSRIERHHDMPLDWPINSGRYKRIMHRLRPYHASKFIIESLLQNNLPRISADV